MSLRTHHLLQAALRRGLAHRSTRSIHTTNALRDRSFTNILADDTPPPVQVNSITSAGIQLADGLLLPSPCVFLEGKVFLWDIPSAHQDTWDVRKEHFELFEVVIPRPEILLLGTGKRIFQPPAFLRPYLNSLGIQLDVMDMRNACATYNLLSEEGRRVSAALLPHSSTGWTKTAA
ncbi:DUF498-domain-containing protein [Infundibulicybe gibba]|nr:DUF498-domain-containing protein [Infundibulicybe gibba]